MQILGPSPNGIYVNGLIFSLFSSLNLSGLKRRGSGWYFGSLWSAVRTMKTDVPFSMTISVPGI